MADKYINKGSLSVSTDLESFLKTEVLPGLDLSEDHFWTSLENIIAHLKQGYCSTIGWQYNYVRDVEELKWLRNKIENNPNFKQFDIAKKESILRELNHAVVFEQFLGKKYIGEKRFSLEGGETTIPALLTIIETAARAETPVDEVVIGMAHRGRLNVLTNILGKTYEEIFIMNIYCS